jgi:NO-binding membrane sensor protein with MHYT domain
VPAAARSGPAPGRPATVEGVVAAGVAASVLLAVAIWMLRRRAVLVVAILFGLALAALDFREMVHQVNESRPSLIAVSVVLAVLHLLVAAIAAVLLRASKGVVAAT